MQRAFDAWLRSLAAGARACPECRHRHRRILAHRGHPVRDDRCARGLDYV